MAVRKRDAGKLSAEQIVNLARTHTIEEIANIDGASYSSVGGILRRRGVSAVQDVETGILHGIANDQKVLGIIRPAYLHLLAAVRLGGVCRDCRNPDLRVLEINHIHGARNIYGAEKKIGSRPSSEKWTLWRKIALGDDPTVLPGFNLLCANCNCLYEYARGRRSEMPPELLSEIADFVTSDAWVKSPIPSVCRNLNQRARLRKGVLQVADIAEMYKTMTIQEIAKIDGGSSQSIYAILEKRGLLKDRTERRNYYDILAKKYGLFPPRVFRLLAIARMGACCCECGIEDIRVLVINHIYGNGVTRRPGGARHQAVDERRIRAVANGGTDSGLNVLCRNCNVLHEYDRGNRKALPECAIEVAKERLSAIDCQALIHKFNFPWSLPRNFCKIG